METELRVSSIIQPVKEEKVEITVNDLERIFTQLLAKIDPKLLYTFDFYFVKNNRTIIQDFLKNFENALKNGSTSTEDVFTITTIFSVISAQLTLLEQLKLDKLTQGEVFTILSATFFSHLKKLLS